MINRCTTLSIVYYVIYNAVTFLNGSQETYTTNFINDTKGDSTDLFTFNYSQLFNEALLPNTVYELTVFPMNTGKFPVVCTYITFMP